MRLTKADAQSFGLFQSWKGGDVELSENDIAACVDIRGLSKAGAIDIHADGSFDATSKRGGWAFVVLRANHVVVTQSDGVDAETNNAVEVTAVLKAAKWACENMPGCQVTIWSDSAHVVEGCNHWRPIWRNNGWKRYNSNPRARNRRIPDWELWAELDRLLLEDPRPVIAWCKGHEGNSGNELADKLAGAAYLPRRAVS